MHTVSPKPVLEARQLAKDFGAGKGVFDVSLTLLPGKVTGFVGPNGAGKSTTISILTGLTRPDQGTLTALGQNYSYKSFYSLARRIGVMYSELTLDERSSPQTVFLQSQALLGKDCSQQWQAMSKLLELDLHKPIKKLSLGNKKKVGIVHALMHRPELIIMDEPTSGLDPIIRERFISMIRQAVADGASVLLSSHDLAEVQEISDSVVMIRAGKIVLDDQTDKIISLAGRTFQLIKPPQQVIDQLRGLHGVTNVTQTNALYSFQTNNYEDTVRLITGAGFYDFYIEKPDLEDSFKEYYE